MTPKEIRIELLKADVTQADIARAGGWSNAHISQVIDDQRVSKKVWQAIAKAIGKPVDSIWPERYRWATDR